METVNGRTVAAVRFPPAGFCDVTPEALATRFEAAAMDESVVALMEQGSDDRRCVEMSCHGVGARGRGGSRRGSPLPSRPFVLALTLTLHGMGRGPAACSRALSVSTSTGRACARKTPR